MGSGGASGIKYVGGYTDIVDDSDDTVISFGGNLTGGISSSAQEGDLVLVYFGYSITQGSAYPLASITDYTEYVNISSTDFFISTLIVGYKFMGATPDSSLTINGGGGTICSGAVGVQVWRDVDSVTPFDVTRTTNTQSSTVEPNPPSITPITDGAYVVAGGHGAHSEGNQTFSSSDLDGFITQGQTVLTDSTIGLGYKKWVSGSFNPAKFTFSGTDSTSCSNCSTTLALRPA